MTTALATMPVDLPSVRSSSALSTFDAKVTSIGALGNLDAFIQTANRAPVLTLEQEQDLAKRLRDQQDLDAARQLVMSHLRLVVAVSRNYLGYGLPHGDLIQEGNIGLMKAVKRFDPDRGVRLVSFAIHWIKAEIHEYILRNWRLVKVATTKAQRKLFFNLRSMKKDSRALTTTEADAIAKELNVRREDVLEMETRMTGNELALEGTPDEGEDSAAFAPIAYLRDEDNEPTQVLNNRRRDQMQSEGIEQALAALDDRSRRIVTERWLRDDGGATLHDLAAEYGVSAERIRQIEVKAMQKMKAALAQYA